MSKWTVKELVGDNLIPTELPKDEANKLFLKLKNADTNCILYSRNGEKLIIEDSHMKKFEAPTFNTSVTGDSFSDHCCLVERSTMQNRYNKTGRL